MAEPKTKRQQDRELDEELDDSFPASDPPGSTSPGTKPGAPDHDSDGKDGRRRQGALRRGSGGMPIPGR